MFHATKVCFSRILYELFSLSGSGAKFEGIFPSFKLSFKRNRCCSCSCKLVEMEALQFDLSQKKLIFGKIPIPEIVEQNQVLIKVAYAGICGTDLHIIQGEFPCNSERPITLGHEFSGIVNQIGEQVTNFKVGDKVSVDPNIGCQKCKSCHSGNPHFCKRGGINTTIGIFRDGGWAEYALCPENQVHKLPEPITLEQAALCEPLSCLSHGLDLASPIKVGKTILIIGAGIIGNLWASALHHQGHRKVTVSEPNESRLNNLKKLDFGFELVTPDQLSYSQRVDKEFGFDFVIDCSGYAPAIENAVTLLNPGGKLVIFGVSAPQARISVSPFQIYAKELTIVGVNINPYSFPNSIGMIEAMQDRYLNYDNLGIKVFHLAEYENAIQELRGGSIAKAIFKF